MHTLIQKQKNILTVAMVAALSVSAPRFRAEEKQKSTKTAKAELPQLQLVVNVPPHWRPFLSNDLAEAFATRLAEVFRRKGYTEEIRFLDEERADAEAPVLAVGLANWRINRADRAVCTFTASLNCDGQQHTVGTFEKDLLVWNDRFGRWGLANALADVADRALRDLSDRLNSMGVLSGFPTRTA